MPSITPFLWFEADAEEAIKFYTEVFQDSSIGSIHKLSDGVPGPAGEVITGTFTLCGQDFMVLNGGPNGDQSKFTEAISFFVDVETQEEIDHYWGALTADGGMPSSCGWLKDKYGLSWQIVPSILGELMSDSDPQKAERVTQAMLKMKKINIAALRKAYEQAG
jgi:predicted 3-demethylubiquinone-9 3-methyltransferase (glyoxalase superfamily)